MKTIQATYRILIKKQNLMKIEFTSNLLQGNHLADSTFNVGTDLNNGF
ncbi:hypothetical protein [Gillisia limnaea]